MKTKRITMISLALLAIALLASCEQITAFIESRTRALPLIQVYNSNLENTYRLLPNDTMYVQVQGLAPNAMYQVACEDPEGKTITMLTAQADGEGVISPSPLWYDIGFKEDETTGKPKLASTADLALNAFNIRVTGAETDLAMPFFIVYGTNVARKQPIVMAGKNTGASFYLENSFEAGEQVVVKVENLDAFVTAQTKATIYVVPFKGSAYADGENIAIYRLKKEVTLVDDLKEGVALTGTDENGDSWNAGIPASVKGKAFSVIVDFDNNGRYDIVKEGTSDYYLDGIDGNGVAGFIVREDPPPAPAPAKAKYMKANIASGGVFHYDYTNWQYDYDYRDTFAKNGLDTRYAWDWQFGGYGVKAIWNPYITYSGWSWPDPVDEDTPSLYSGSYVRLYIVAGNPDPGTGVVKDSTITSTTAWGPAYITLPVQYSCYNGCGQQTIWRADMTPGNYSVVVDVDRSGTYTDGDIIDNVDSAKALRTVGGFTVNP